MHYTQYMPFNTGGSVMLQGLPTILNHTDLRFVAQPILARDGALYGHEILLRFKHYEGPDALLKIVQHLGLKQDLDLDVCRLAEHMLFWKKDKGCWNINLYAESLCRTELQRELLELARKLQPAFLLIDVLDMSEILDMPHLRRSMQGLHDGGIRFALSVEELSRPYAQFLPFDLIRMNVQQYSPEEWRGWQEEAQVHNLPLLAYRVEQVQQLHELNNLGIALFQGYAVAEEEILAEPRHQL